jgi:hypothetical protein
MPKFPTSVSAILCVGLREFGKLFGRNKECGFHGKKPNQNNQIYTYKLLLGHLLQIFSTVLRKKRLPVVTNVDFAGDIFGRQVSMTFGLRINMTSGGVMVCGYMLE